MNYPNKISNYNHILLSNSQSTIKTKKRLFEEMKHMGDLYSDESCRLRFNTFKNAILCSETIPFGNLFLIALAKQELSLPEETIYLHHRMAAFLFSHNLLTKEEKAKHTVELKKQLNLNPKNCSFKLNIPTNFVPIFTAYVLASTFHKSGIPSATLFFKKMREYLNNEEYYSSTNLTLPKNIKTISAHWLEAYLGEEYFLNLEKLYHTYACTSEQKESLSSSVSLLTEIVTTCPEDRLQLINAANILLKDFEQQISKNREHLYPAEKMFPIQAEKDIKETLLRDFQNMAECHINAIRELKNKYPAKSSEFPLAVSNIRDFTKEYETILSSFEQFQKNALQQIKETFSDILNISMSTPNSLIVNSQNITEHAEILYEIFTKHYKRLKCAYQSFFKDVKISSMPSSYPQKSADCKTKSFSDFENEVKKIINFLKDSLEEKYDPLPSCFQIQTSGFLKEHGFTYPYPNNLPYYIITTLSEALPNQLNLDTIEVLTKTSESFCKMELLDFLNRIFEILD